MRNITKIEKYGRNSIAKACELKPRAYRRKTIHYAAFTVKSKRVDGPSYVVRIAVENSRRVLADCVESVTGEPCKGFLFNGHCYHVGRALMLV